MRPESTCPPGADLKLGTDPRAREIATEARAWAENVVLLHGVYMYTILRIYNKQKVAHNVL